MSYLNCLFNRGPPPELVHPGFTLYYSAELVLTSIGIGLGRSRLPAESQEFPRSGDVPVLRKHMKEAEEQYSGTERKNK